MNYQIHDPWDWVTIFEKLIAQYTGSRYAVACDSNSNAIRLLLHYLNITNQEITIPARTYVSVPNQIILSGNRPTFEDIKWDGMYELGNTNIVDAAGSFHVDMYNKFFDSYMILSFHHRKILHIGTGGMILTNDEKFNEWARPMIYDGRHKDKMYKDDEFECIGWHMYMSPEQAELGMEIFNSNSISLKNKNCVNSEMYKDLRKSKIFNQYV